MPDVTPRFPPDKLRYYPHMFPKDIEIWERFLESFGNNYIGFDYDVKVGISTEAPPHYSKKYVEMIGTLSKYRIDVVGYDSSTIYIIEVKPAAGPSAIGQVTAYLQLYEREFTPPQLVKGVIVTDWYIEDIDDLTTRLGIDYYVV